MSPKSTIEASPQRRLKLYDDALPQVYGYLHRRCRNTSVAEDITTEVFVGAVESINRTWTIGRSQR